jgi:tetratricopeptide (TPR) repeat protein
MDRFPRLVGCVPILLVFLAGQSGASPTRGQRARESGAQAAEKAREALLLHQQVVELMGAGRFKEAIPLARRSLELSRAVHGDVHGNVSAELITLAAIYRYEGDFFNAEPLIVKAIEIDKILHGADHPEVAVDVCTLAMLYSSKGSHAAARKQYQRAQTLLRKAKSTADVVGKQAECHLGMAQTMLERERYADAMAAFDTAATLLEKTDPQRARGLLIQWAETARSHDDQRRATRWLERARTTR